MSLNYKNSGVDIEAGNELIQRIKKITKNNKRSEIINHLGGFNAMCRIPNSYKSPILVSSTDGVGTKLKIALDANNFNGIGIDLVAMCVNDIIVSGAEPLFFLDYYSVGKLDINIAEKVIKSIHKGCQIANCSLVGGETAEMPGMYQNNDFDLAGFCVGVLEEEKAIDGSKIQSNHILIGLASNGIHSNGYSLIRQILKKNNINLSSKLDQLSWAEELLKPTKIYVKSLLKLFQSLPVDGLAHITGGGITENLPRVLPKNCDAVIQNNNWEIPHLFQKLQNLGKIETSEMFKTFNCGIGMILCIAEKHVNQALKILKSENEKAFIIGNVIKSQSKKPKVIYQ